MEEQCFSLSGNKDNDSGLNLFYLKQYSVFLALWILTTFNIITPNPLALNAAFPGVLREHPCDGLVQCTNKYIIMWVFLILSILHVTPMIYVIFMWLQWSMTCISLNLWSSPKTKVLNLGSTFGWRNPLFLFTAANILSTRSYGGVHEWDCGNGATTMYRYTHFKWMMLLYYLNS